MGLLIGVDVPILLDSPDLMPFFVLMVSTMVVFGVYIVLENFVFKKKFSQSASSLDNWILVMAIVRNVVFVLSVIPFIQLFGMLALSLGGLPYLILYIVLLVKRSGVTPTGQSSS